MSISGIDKLRTDGAERRSEDTRSDRTYVAVVAIMATAIAVFGILLITTEARLTKLDNVAGTPYLNQEPQTQEQKNTASMLPQAMHWWLFVARR